MNVHFYSLFAANEVNLTEDRLRITWIPFVGVKRERCFSANTIWPAIDREPVSHFFRAGLMLPGCFSLYLALIQGFALIDVSMHLYVLVVLGALGILFAGVWLGASLKNCTLVSQDNQKLLRVLGTSKNCARLSKLVDALKAIQKHEPPPVFAFEEFQSAIGSPSLCQVTFVESPEDSVKRLEIESRLSRAPNSSNFPIEQFFIYWAAILTTWVAFAWYGLHRSTDLISILAGYGSLVLGLSMTTINWRRTVARGRLRQPPLPSVETMICASSEALVCHFPSHALALRWQHVFELLIEESGAIAVCHISRVVFIPGRAFTDNNQRNSFIAEIRKRAPHLAAS
jgi:hypothetical protein